MPPVKPAPPDPKGADLYDAQYWESIYLEDQPTPRILVQLQDELSRSRRREAFWISVVVHLVFILMIVNLERIERLLPHRAVIVAAPALDNQKDLTYLTLPPDEQQVSKRPNTNIISDKDRTAMSRAPQLDRQELKRILDASRQGRPGPVAPQSPQQPQPTQPSPPAVQGQPTPQPQQQQRAAAPPPPPPTNQSAKLQTPPNPFANAGSMTAGDAIAQAERDAARNRGGVSGDNGDYGLGVGRKPTAAMGPLDVLTDTMGVDFGPYLQRVLHDVKMNWYNLIPESAKAPIMKKGKVSIEFAIMKDGSVAGMKLDSSSGDVALDRGAWGGITASNPFPPLPQEFGGQYLALRFHFYYNPDRSDLQ